VKLPKGSRKKEVREESARECIREGKLQKLPKGSRKWRPLNATTASTLNLGNSQKGVESTAATLLATRLW